MITVYITSTYDVTCIELSPSTEQRCLRRCCISGIPASWASSLSFSSLSPSLVAMSSSSILQSHSPLN